MGPITYSLCQTAYIGVAMWLTGMCAFPPLVPDTPVVLKAPGLVLARQFEAPVSKTYVVSLDVKFASTEARLSNTVMGRGAMSEFCDSTLTEDRVPADEREWVGETVPLRVVVRSHPDGTLVSDKTLYSRCASSHVGERAGRQVGFLNLAKGAYTLQVYNLRPQPGFTGTKTSISLHTGHGK